MCRTRSSPSKGPTLRRVSNQGPEAAGRDPHLNTPTGKPRARSVGLKHRGIPGPHNAITDVPGVEVGYQTLIEGENVRTGVTAIHPRGKANPGDPVAAGYFSLNGNGELTGVSWIEESGTCQGPVTITNTHAVGIAHAGVVAWMNQDHPELTDVWLLPMAGETWDGYLNDINGHHVNEEHVIQALRGATSDQPDEGSVGGGTGMNCYQFKGGNGTASRRVGYADTIYTVGVFLQANFGRRDELTLTGVYLGEELKGDNPMSETRASPPPGGGSVIAVVATDAPLFPHQCKALARRVSLGLARTGTSSSHFSGDIFLAISTANPGAFTDSDLARLRPGGYNQLTFIPWGNLDPFYEAVVQATEEAVANALIANEDMTGRDGHRTPALPRRRLAEILAAARR
ncbi:S58 family peptidase [Trebonia kvetii]|uniref:S58 family peptidase n=1 Tax=Trebonia kvetii TaxID=2480626 RepID=A0A6P2BW58_9ACTN|nr:S58 family peptidase [Trebonia kvetii]